MLRHTGFSTDILEESTKFQQELYCFNLQKCFSGDILTSNGLNPKKEYHSVFARGGERK